MDQVVQSLPTRPGHLWVGAGGARGTGAGQPRVWLCESRWSSRTRRPRIPARLNHKAFTAAAILLLEERGKLRVDDAIKKHLAIRRMPGIRSPFFIFSRTPRAFRALPVSGLPTTKLVSTPIEQIVASFRDKTLDFSQARNGITATLVIYCSAISSRKSAVRLTNSSFGRTSSPRWA